jgi:DNA repair exonuclease SbcCD ATPase subunit
MPVRGQNDNSGGADVELLSQELEKTKQELKNLQDKLKEFEKLTDEIGVEINAIGNKPQEIHEQQKQTKNLVADVSVKVLAVIGAFSGVY